MRLRGLKFPSDCLYDCNNNAERFSFPKRGFVASAQGQSSQPECWRRFRVGLWCWVFFFSFHSRCFPILPLAVLSMLVLVTPCKAVPVHYSSSGEPRQVPTMAAAMFQGRVKSLGKGWCLQGQTSFYPLTPNKSSLIISKRLNHIALVISRDSWD